MAHEKQDQRAAETSYIIEVGCAVLPRVQSILTIKYFVKEPFTPPSSDNPSTSCPVPRFDIDLLFRARKAFARRVQLNRLRQRVRPGVPLTENLHTVEYHLLYAFRRMSDELSKPRNGQQAGVRSGVRSWKKEKPVICIIDASADVSGAFVAAQREAELLAEEATFILVTTRRTRIPPARLEAFAKIYALPIVSLRRSILAALMYVPSLIYCSFALRIILSKEKCRRLQLNDFHFAHGTVLRLLGFDGRIITWVRVNPDRFGVIGMMWMWLTRHSSDQIIAVSNAVRPRLPGAQRVRVVYDFSVEGPPVGPSPEPNLVLMGNYDPGKGHDVAIAAFHRVADKHPSARLLFFGGDMGLAGQKTNLSRLREAASMGPGAGRIEFRDFVNHPVDALAEARAALSCSRSESFSLVCQEASAHGIPVIATRSGGPQEIVEDGVTGFLVDVDDVEAIARHMYQLLSDAFLARKLGMAGAALMRERFPASSYKVEFREVFGL